ncbi:MAG TPA: SMP-30/gluconolactonase/LRE family protein [Bryobacteraceae bacterium]|jgi:gluconolactonase
MGNFLCAVVLLAGVVAAQDFTDLRFDRIANTLRYAEAPVWSPDGSLLYADVPSNTIWQWKGGSKPIVYATQSNGAGGMAYDAQGRLYVCEWHGRRVVRVDKKGRREVLAEKWEGKRLNSPNDIAIRKDGNLWFTDPAFGSGVDARELDFYGVFHLNPKGELGLVAKWKTRPNGIAVSPAGHILYVTNADERKLYAFDLDRNGAATNPRVVIADIQGVPGGVRLDEKGNLYIAARHLLIYTPAGKLLRKVELPEAASNCAFGESDLESLFVTAKSEVYRIRVPVKGALLYPPVPQQPAN